MIIKDNTKISPLPDDELINHKEKKWKVKLPASYREFLKENGGAIPETRTFHGEEDKYFIERFLSIFEKPRELPMFSNLDISVVLTTLDCRLISDEDLVGVELLPIAEVYSGNYLCLDYAESRDEPSVCVWFHENSDDFDPCVETIADTIEEFFDMLE